MADRDRLVHLLTEAAEIEHNLLCSYLYAAFSLKRGAQGGLSPTESDTVAKWRTTVLGVAIEEMAHLALVKQPACSAGWRSSLRPAQPAGTAGYHPAGFVIRLTPLTKATLDHFIFLERPADAEVSVSIAEGSPQRGMGMTTPAMTGKHRHEPTYAERGLSQSNG